MATHSSNRAWRCSWTEEPGGLQFMESQRVRHDGVYTHTHDGLLTSIQSCKMGVNEIIYIFISHYYLIKYLEHSL